MGECWWNSRVTSRLSYDERVLLKLTGDGRVSCDERMYVKPFWARLFEAFPNPSQNRNHWPMLTLQLRNSCQFCPGTFCRLRLKTGASTRYSFINSSWSEYGWMDGEGEVRRLGLCSCVSFIFEVSESDAPGCSGKWIRTSEEFLLNLGEFGENCCFQVKFYIRC